MLRIGCCQSDITPAPPVIMGGSFLKFESREILDPVMAGCVVADDGHTRAAIVSCDLGSISNDMLISIREQVSRATGTPGENLFVMATHNHSGPTVQVRRDNPFCDDETAPKLDRARKKLADDIAACVIRAHERLEPARMGYGRGRFNTGNFNRRFIMSNGRSRMHGGGNLERLCPEGPTDPEVQAVWFEGAEGRPLAVMVNYASHPTNFYGRPLVSADFPGFMRGVLHGVLGGDVPILYLQGACGNLMCRDVTDPKFPSGIDNARRTGRGLAGETLRIMSDNVARAGDVRIKTDRRIIAIPYRDTPPMPFDEANEKWEYYRNHWEDFCCLDIEDRANIHSSLRMQGYRNEAAGEDVEISALVLGDVFFVCNPAEFFVEHQLDIKKHFAGRNVIVTELTNGRTSYVPTRLACALGGYETIISRFNPGTGERIRDACVELLETVISLQAFGDSLAGGKRNA